MNAIDSCYVLSAIGKVTNVVLKQHALQWDPSEVQSGDNSSLVLYNVTIANSSMVPIDRGTTANTLFSIDSTLYIPCENYSISVLPYQMVSSGVKEGIPVQIFEEYTGGKFISYSKFLCCIQFILTQKHTMNKPLSLLDMCYCYIALPVANSINVVVTRYPLSASIAITFMVRS